MFFLLFDNVCITCAAENTHIYAIIIYNKSLKEKQPKYSKYI